jgi:DNA-binding SARP family transcriptional activator
MWTLSLLGCWRLEQEGVLISVAPAAQRLLALLALRGPSSRAVLAGTLWPEAGEVHAVTNLRAALHRVRRQLPGLLADTRDPVCLDPAVDIDIHQLSTSPARPAGLAGGRTLADDLLPGWYDDWLFFERERVRQMWLHSVEERAADLAGAGDFRHGLDLALVAIGCEPLRESAHRLVVSIHLAEGNPSEAVRAFDAYRLLVSDELGLEPTQQMRQLVAPYRNGARSTSSAEI